MSEASTAKKYWRSLNELENSPEFEEMLHREFPVAASEFPQGISRRRWLQLMGASLALGGLTGCRYKEEKFAPLSARPVDRIPGRTDRYATSIELAGGVRHLLVTCYDGRPLKVEGNAEHPAGQRGTDAWAQACILEMYDPDRGSTVRQRSGKQAVTRQWSDFDQVIGESLNSWKAAAGEGLAVLFEPTESIALRAMLESLQTAFPKVRLYQHASISRDNAVQGSQLAFGKSYRTHLVLDKAEVIVSLDADLLVDHPAALRLAKDFAAGRDADKGSMNRLYVVESQFTVTGASADHRLAVRSSDIGRVLSEIERLVDEHLEEKKVHVDASADKREHLVQAIADDLVSHPGRAVIAVGLRQPPEVHARVHRLNARLQNAGQTVRYTEEEDLPSGDLKSLIAEIDAGNVKTALILGGNPVYDSPADIDVAGALAKLENSVHLSVYENETSEACQWYLPGTHAFEAWGDARAWDGTISVTQPLIEPVLGGRSALQLLAQLCGDDREPQQIVRSVIEQAHGQPLTDDQWRRFLHDGYLDGSRFAPAEAAPAEAADEAESSDSVGEDDLEVVFCTDASVYDGRFANNGWLQETPRFLSKLTWDNAAIVSPATAAKLGVEHGKLVTVEVDGRSLQLPAFVLPGQAEGSIAIALGYGRTAAGKVGGSERDGIAPVGFNANVLRTSEAPFFATGVTVSGSQQAYKLATTQDHHAIDTVGLEETGKRVGKLVREGDLAHFQEHPDFARHMTHTPPLESLWTEFDYEGNAWGMAIDLNKCIGCNACMVACQAENNVPVVGKEQVSRGREMHWLRIDRYFSGQLDNPEAVHQPVACHHCENAPCEQVCPVAATVHSQEGLNDMVYNRCIGTRYCANNCPYKVRRFNYFDNTKRVTGPGNELVQLSVNPEVTVRTRGVMEKCTYCVQRIQNGKIDAKSQRRDLADGDIVTACQQACPTQAIEFGNLNDENSRVARAHANPRAYGLLTELNIKPRTNYLARIRNPHPALAREHSEEESHGPGAAAEGTEHA